MKQKSTILSTSYFPPINYFKSFISHDKIYLEEQEYYQRHSIRNRATIMGANGILLLSVPIQKKSSSKTIIKNIKIANTDWKKNHIYSIQSAYGSSPFFIYYFEQIIKIINKKYDFLIDLNNDILDYFLNVFEIQKNIIKTHEYIDYYASDVIDQRRRKNILYNNKKYQQVFGDKFKPNLSVIDLIFNLGPYAKEYIYSC